MLTYGIQAAFADMKDEEYQKFICIEPGCVNTAIEVPSHKQLVLCQLLTICI